MKKRFLSLLLALALMCALCLPALASDASGAELAAERRNGVVRVISFGIGAVYVDDNGDPIDYMNGFSRGTAFAVGIPGEKSVYFVTNSHCVVDQISVLDTSGRELGSIVGELSSEVYIATDDSLSYDGANGTVNIGNAIPCEVVYYSEDLYPDFAILRADYAPDDRVALPLAYDEGEMEVLDPVYALGFPGTSDDMQISGGVIDLDSSIDNITATAGEISRFTTSPNTGSTRLIQHTAQINPGNSGGPLLDELGRVTGINTYSAGSAATGESLSFYAVRIQYVIDKLDELGIEHSAEEAGGASVLAFIAVGAVLIAAAAIVLTRRRRPAPAAPVPEPEPEPEPVTEPKPFIPPQPRAIPGDSGLRLQGRTGAFQGRRFAIAGSVRVGRDPDGGGLVFPSNTPGVSGRHCELISSGGVVYLVDRGSHYGTFLNGIRLAANDPAPVKPGDVVELGSPQQSFVIVRSGGGV